MPSRQFPPTQYALPSLLSSSSHSTCAIATRYIFISVPRKSRKTTCIGWLLRWRPSCSTNTAVAPKNTLTNYQLCQHWFCIIQPLIVLSSLITTFSLIRVATQSRAHGVMWRLKRNLSYNLKYVLVFHVTRDLIPFSLHYYVKRIWFPFICTEIVMVITVYVLHLYKYL